MLFVKTINKVLNKKTFFENLCNEESIIQVRSKKEVNRLVNDVMNAYVYSRMELIMLGDWRWELERGNEYMIEKAIEYRLYKLEQVDSFDHEPLIYKQDECSICLEPMNEFKTVLLCGHYFHSLCFFNFERNHKCPLCRRPVKSCVKCDGKTDTCSTTKPKKDMNDGKYYCVCDVHGTRFHVKPAPPFPERTKTFCVHEDLLRLNEGLEEFYDSGKKFKCYVYVSEEDDPDLPDKVPFQIALNLCDLTRNNHRPDPSIPIVVCVDEEEEDFAPLEIYKEYENHGIKLIYDKQKEKAKIDFKGSNLIPVPKGSIFRPKKKDIC